MFSNKWHMINLTSKIFYAFFRFTHHSHEKFRCWWLFCWHVLCWRNRLRVQLKIVLVTFFLNIIVFRSPISDIYTFNTKCIPIHVDLSFVLHGIQYYWCYIYKTIIVTMLKTLMPHIIWTVVLLYSCFEKTKFLYFMKFKYCETAILILCFKGIQEYERLLYRDNVI